jgi:AhpD family alkylhydroperoxidase
MPHVTLPEGLPGILGPMAFSPETARPLNELAEVLLRGPNTLTSAERELIATYTSSQNDCHFCQSSHGAAATHHLEGDDELVAAVKADPESAPISGKLRALLAIAGREIHDAVLIAAAFCMYNRYVDGLATWAPQEPEAYRDTGRRLAEEGYVRAGEEIARAVAPVAG